MIALVDRMLNRVTMYRLVVYYLMFLIGVATILSFGGVLAYDPFALLFSTGFLIAVCWASNLLLAWGFSVAPATDSTYITAMILALIITPLEGYSDLWFLSWAGAIAMASKYLLVIDRKHLFNPAAAAVAITYLTVNESASWWVGNPILLPFVVVGGLLVVRKIRRGAMVATFLVAVSAATLLLSLPAGEDPLTTLGRTLLYAPIFFFAFVFVTEPLTTPPTRRWQLIYGGLVGLLSAPQVHLGSFYVTPELAIIAGNLLSYLVSPKAKLVLRLKEKIQLAPDIYDFVFQPAGRLAFAPGQYMEWTLGHREPDDRGNRRYFTLASSPSEEELRIGVKFYQQSSSYKQAMLKMQPGSEIVAAQLAGDFTLPTDTTQKCVLIAGGVGITPFRSMIKQLLDTGERRPITLLYSNRAPRDIVYQDVFDRAREELGVKTVYTVTDARKLPANWKGRVGRITPQMIQAEVPDFQRCIFYLSGPPSMVDSFKETLHVLGVRSSQVRTDFFSGLA
ncbi:oxidoreductase [Chloroflexales bacterium ZM16-3]|nr:oxidoreductase [Chloroflexales bacterium ZM16-3]